jgi:hypothetical protein
MVRTFCEQEDGREEGKDAGEDVQGGTLSSWIRIVEDVG